MSHLVLSEIYIYPIKSLGGISLTAAQVEERGLQYDRRWMLIDESGMFLTQRKLAEMALLDVTLHANHLEVMHRTKSLPPLQVPLQTNSSRSLLVTIWEDICFAYVVSSEANAWFSEALGVDCRLVYMPENSIRLIDPNYAKHNEKLNFADGFPYLITGQASLNDLNSSLEQPVSMHQFRPTFVFTGGLPHDEENWKTFKIGDVLFYGAKPSTFCSMPAVDQSTAGLSQGSQAAMTTRPKQGNSVLFGMNLIGLSTGTVQVGDKIQVMEALQSETF